MKTEKDIYIECATEEGMSKARASRIWDLKQSLEESNAKYLDCEGFKQNDRVLVEHEGEIVSGIIPNKYNDNKMSIEVKLDIKLDILEEWGLNKSVYLPYTEIAHQ
jgi:hypothetical protein